MRGMTRTITKNYNKSNLYSTSSLTVSELVENKSNIDVQTESDFIIQEESDED